MRVKIYTISLPRGLDNESIIYEARSKAHSTVYSTIISDFLQTSIETGLANFNQKWFVKSANVYGQ